MIRRESCVRGLNSLLRARWRKLTKLRAVLRIQAQAVLEEGGSRERGSTPNPSNGGQCVTHVHFNQAALTQVKEAISAFITTAGLLN